MENKNINQSCLCSLPFPTTESLARWVQGGGGGGLTGVNKAYKGNGTNKESF